ncbi:MAG: PilZ domain-containing protein [Pseudolabrys sp.]
MTDRHDKRQTQIDTPRDALFRVDRPRKEHPRECALSDISETGARIEAENADQLPDQFTLLLSKRGTPTRQCRVVWREANQIGVEFESSPAQPKPFRRSSGDTPPAVADAPPVAAEPQPIAADAEPAQSS